MHYCVSDEMAQFQDQAVPKIVSRSDTFCLYFAGKLTSNPRCELDCSWSLEALVGKKES